MLSCSTLSQIYEAQFENTSQWCVSTFQFAFNWCFSHVKTLLSFAFSKTAIIFSQKWVELFRETDCVIIYVAKIICYMFIVTHKAVWKWRGEMSKTQFTSGRLHDLIVVVPPIKRVNSKDEGLPGGFLLPSGKIAQCSQTCPHRFSWFVPSLTYILKTPPLPRHKHKNSVVPAFLKQVHAPLFPKTPGKPSKTRAKIKKWNQDDKSGQYCWKGRAQGLLFLLYLHLLLVKSPSSKILLLAILRSVSSKRKPLINIHRNQVFEPVRMKTLAQGMYVT